MPFLDFLIDFISSNLLIDGMWDRTLTISSAGKLFSATGWKVGWVYGPQHLIESGMGIIFFLWLFRTCFENHHIN